MLTKRFLSVFFILCVLLVGCAFAASSEQPKDEALPESPGMITASDIQAVYSVSIVDAADTRTPPEVLHAIMLGIGDEKQLKAVVSADTPEEEEVTWSSSNEAVATVSPVGKVRALATELTNPAVITATCGSQSAQVRVYAGNPNVRVEGLFIYKEGTREVTSGDIEISVIVGTSANLVAVLQPAQADIRHVDWYTANSDIVGVGWDPAMPTNATVTAHRAGRTLVEAVTLDGQKRRTCFITAYIEEKGAVEGGCATGILPSAAGIAILAPLLLLLKRKKK